MCTHKARDMRVVSWWVGEKIALVRFTPDCLILCSPSPPSFSHSHSFSLSFARSRTQSLPICLPFLPFSFPTPLYMILSHFLNLRHAISFAISLSRMKSMKVHLVSLISSHSIISCTIRNFQSCIFFLNALVRSKNLRICSQTYENLRRKT